MDGRLIYVELKSGFNDNGPAWIGRASTSKSGSTIYFNGKAFKSLKGSGVGANYFDIVSGEEYWISGIKKNNQDRHWAGSGSVNIDKQFVTSYLDEMNLEVLPKNLIPCDLLPSVRQDVHEEVEHGNGKEYTDDYLSSIPSGRSGAIKIKR